MVEGVERRMGDRDEGPGPGVRRYRSRLRPPTRARPQRRSAFSIGQLLEGAPAAEGLRQPDESLRTERKGRREPRGRRHDEGEATQLIDPILLQALRAACAKNLRFLVTD